MRKILLLLLLMAGAAPCWATAYFISPTGVDTNNGLSTGAPWLTPNHAVNCGDTITAATGTYSSANFYNGQWGTVTCPASNNVAWLICATFDACKISATTQQGMYVSASYWGIAGWEITDSWSFGNCFYIQPTGATSVHHVIFADNVAIGCVGGGFVAYSTSSSPAVDYIALVGNIAYGTSGGSAVCASGFSLGFLPQLDSNSGTHLFVAGNFAWNNFDPATCAGTPATDGEGIIIDTLKQYNYNQQVVVENNITVGNGGRGVLQNNNNASSPATIYLKQNTAYGNDTQTGQDFPSGNGEIMIAVANNTTATGNLAMTSQGTTGGNAIYAFSLNGSGDTVSANWFYSAAGNTTIGSGYGTNTTGTNPAFVSTTIPGSPTCTGLASTVACAATLISNFTPTASGSTGYGYQPVSLTSINDGLFPTWLCNGNALITGMPTGLVTPGCGVAGSSTNTTTQSGSTQSGASSN